MSLFSHCHGLVHALSVPSCKTRLYVGWQPVPMQSKAGSSGVQGQCVDVTEQGRQQLRVLMCVELRPHLDGPGG